MSRILACRTTGFEVQSAAGRLPIGRPMSPAGTRDSGVRDVRRQATMLHPLPNRPKGKELRIQYGTTVRAGLPGTRSFTFTNTKAPGGIMPSGAFCKGLTQEGEGWCHFLAIRYCPIIRLAVQFGRVSSSRFARSGQLFEVLLAAFGTIPWAAFIWPAAYFSFGRPISRRSTSI